MFYYLIYACFSTTVFLVMSARKKDRNRLPWYDLVLAAFVFGTMIYCTAHTWEIGAVGWLPAPHTLALVLACIITPLAIEGARRMAGWLLVITILILGPYPLFAPYMPVPLRLCLSLYPLQIVEECMDMIVLTNLSSN